MDEGGRVPNRNYGPETMKIGFVSVCKAKARSFSKRTRLLVNAQVPNQCY